MAIRYLLIIFSILFTQRHTYSNATKENPVAAPQKDNVNAYKSLPASQLFSLWRDDKYGCKGIRNKITFAIDSLEGKDLRYCIDNLGSPDDSFRNVTGVGLMYITGITACHNCCQYTAKEIFQNYSGAVISMAFKNDDSGKRKIYKFYVVDRFN